MSRQPVKCRQSLFFQKRRCYSAEFIGSVFNHLVARAVKRVLFRHLEFDSPYNTYKYAGLPPGPICVPDKEYLDAVLNPDYGGGNLFFCASKNLDGTHVFAKTAEAHGRNAKAFQNALKNNS